MFLIKSIHLVKENIRVNIATAITLARIAMVPLFCILFSCFPQYRTLALVIFVVAACTDWLDGYIARRFLHESRLGAWLDFLADKILLTAGLLVLVATYHDQWLTLASIVMIVRELSVLALRGWLADSAAGIKLRVSSSAKLKTAFQFISIILMLAWIDGHGYASTMSGYSNVGQFVLYIPWIMFYLSVVLAVYSLFGYAKQCFYLPCLRE